MLFLLSLLYFLLFFLCSFNIVLISSFSAVQLATRISHAKPKIIVSASGGIEPKKGIIEYKPLLDEAIELASHKPEKVIVSFFPIYFYLPPLP